MTSIKRFIDKTVPVLALVAMIPALWAVLILAPTERTIGDVQRIFYFHFASAVTALICFTCVLGASMIFLVRRSSFWDSLARACGEVGVMFCTFVLVTGPIWARPVWGKWWVWDPRLTTTLVLWFLYVGYLVLRNALQGPRGAVAAAVFAILAYVDVPVVYFSVRWWRGIHPQVLQGGGGLDRGMVAPLLLSAGAFLVLAAALVLIRFDLERMTDSIRRLESALEEKL